MSVARRAARWLNAHAPAPVRSVAIRAIRRGQRNRSRREVWQENMPDELDHWREVFRTETAHVAWLSDPDGLVSPDSLLATALALVEADEVEVLDVGSGPMTPLGHVFEGKRLRITAIDPLADMYDRLLAEHAIEPPTRTVPGSGEALREQFPDASFDIACALNTLDHTYDPFAVIEQMLGVVRPGGRVLLDHRRNEAENRLYRGLHQWNLDERDGRLVIWNPDERIDVTGRLGDRADIGVAHRGDRIWVTLTKRA